MNSTVKAKFITLIIIATTKLQQFQAPCSRILIISENTSVSLLLERSAFKCMHQNTIIYVGKGTVNDGAKGG